MNSTWMKNMKVMRLLSDETKNRNCILAEYDIVPAGIEITKMDTKPTSTCLKRFILMTWIYM